MINSQAINWRNVLCPLEENDKTLPRGIKEELEEWIGISFIDIKVQCCDEFRSFGMHL